jgi:hypothetical protein
MGASREILPPFGRQDDITEGRRDDIQEGRRDDMEELSSRAHARDLRRAGRGVFG